MIVFLVVCHPLLNYNIIDLTLTEDNAQEKGDSDFYVFQRVDEDKFKIYRSLKQGYYSD